MDGAEVYLLMIRKSLLPILGESMAPAPYFQQVEILDWDWKFVNQEEVDKKEAERKVEDKITEFNEIKAKPDREIELDLNILRFDTSTTAAIQRIIADASMTPQEKMLRIKDLQDDELEGMGKEMQDDAVDQQAQITKQRLKEAQSAKKAYDKKKKLDAQNNLKFNFSKRVDFASTQMLNCMKAGEILPRVVLTIMHRSVNLPLLLVITAKNLRFTNYQMSVEVDETMADMKEEWEAEFSDISFLYSSRGTAGGPKNAAEALTTQQVRVFTMTPRD